MEGRHPAPPAYDVVHDDLFDWARIRRYVIFSLGSVRRRAFLFTAVVASMVALSAGALKVLPKTYEVECRLLAQKNPALAVKADASLTTDPTRAAAETIVRHENLEDLMRESDLLAQWPLHRAPILRMKDWVMARVSAPQPPEDLAKGLLGLMEKNLTVWTTPDGTVVIHLIWPDDPVMAYRLVDAAQQNFLEKRHVIEVEAVGEQISILEGHAAALKNEIANRVQQIEAKQAQVSRDRRTRNDPRARAPAFNPISPDVTNLRVKLEAKRRALSDLEEYRRRHLAELQTRLAEQRVVFSAHHPAIVDLEQSIESLKHDSPQVLALRQDEADLRQQLTRLTGGSDEPAPAALAIPPDLFSERSENTALEYERAQLRFQVQQYAHMQERIDASRIELDTAQAAFKYRYLIVAPPEVPRGPVKPKKLVVLGASLVVGLFLALFATTLADFRSGALIEKWQLQDLLEPGQAVIEVRLR